MLDPMDCHPKVLVLGGTGAMGRELVRILDGRGYDVTVTSRRHRMLEGSSVRCSVGNAKDPDFLADVLSCRFDAIVDFMIWSTEEFRIVAPLLLDCTYQYVFLSSYRVYADSEVITEDSPRLLDVCSDSEYLATDEYALRKARCEDVLLKSGRTNWSIVRPGITYNGGVGRLQLGVMESQLWL